MSERNSDIRSKRSPRAEEVVTQVSLSAISGSPLDDELTREKLLEIAGEIAMGVHLEIFDYVVTGDSVTFVVGGDELTSFGFVAELRERSNTWYEGKYRDGTLWGTAKP